MKEECIKEIRKYFNLNHNENTMYQNLGNTARAIRGKFMPLNAYIRNEKVED